MKPLLSHAVRRAPVAAAALVAVLALSAELPAQQQSQQASGRTRVLVPPLQTADGVNDDFGNNVAERVRERLQNFDILTAVTGDEIDDALDEFDLDPVRLSERFQPLLDRFREEGWGADVGGGQG